MTTAGTQTLTTDEAINLFWDTGRAVRLAQPTRDHVNHWDAVAEMCIETYELLATPGWDASHMTYQSAARMFYMFLVQLPTTQFEAVVGVITLTGGSLPTITDI
jgi:hypothetical protein